MSSKAIEPAKQSLAEYEMTLSPDQLRKVITDNVGDDGIKVHNLQRIINPSGKSTKWEIPLITGDTETTSEIEGIIVFHKLSRARWAGQYDGGSEAPVCSSRDGITGVGLPGGACRECPYAKFTEKEDGTSEKPECRLVKQVFIRRPGKLLPMILNVSAVNRDQINSYMFNLLSEGLSYNQVVTKVFLTPDKAKSGFDYAKVNFAATSILSPEQAKESEEYTNLIKPMLLEIELSAEDGKEPF